MIMAIVFVVAKESFFLMFCCKQMLVLVSPR